MSGSNRFDQALAAHGLPSLRACGLRKIQVNVGNLCNQQCAHCHLGAGPAGRESMTREVLDAVKKRVSEENVAQLDITGGAPELYPLLRELVSAGRDGGKSVIVRTNLTAMLEKEREEGLATWLAERRVELVASLPCYTEANVDAQRGVGVFTASVQALSLLNDLGYGHRPDLPLSLVYNPVGASLPGDQLELEADYRRRLSEDHGIVFTRLLALANVPLGRFVASLATLGGEESYLELLREAFNPEAAAHLMCRTQVSIGHDGALYDCDFHLASNRSVEAEADHVSRWDRHELDARTIPTADYCLACTAGAGSSCGGSLVGAVAASGQ